MSKLIWPLFLFLSLSLVGQKSNQGELDIYLYEDLGFLNYKTEGNEKKGLFPELINRLKESKTIKFKTIEKDEDSFEKYIDHGIPDIVMGVEDYKRNNDEYYYLDKPIELDGVMITRKDFPHIDHDFDFFDKTIVYVEGDKILSKKLEDSDDRMKLISKSSTKEALESVVSGEADVYIEDQQDTLKYWSSHQAETGLKVNYLSSPLKTQYYIGGRKEYKKIVDEIGLLMDEMELDESFFFRELMKYTGAKIEMHKDIETYIKNNRSIEVFIPEDSSLYPMYYTDNFGEKKGFLVDYFSEISSATGIDMDLKESNQSDEFYINPFVLTINGKEIGSEGYLTTEAYYNYNIFLFNKVEREYISSDEELANYRIAVTKNSVEEKYFVNKGLEGNLIIYGSYLEGLKSVSRGDTDLFAGTIKKTNDILEKNKVKNIKVMGDINDTITLKVGISEDKELLYFIINSFNKSYSYLIPEKNKEILETRIEISTDYKLSLLISLLSIIAFYSIWRYLKRIKRLHIKLEKITFGLVETLESANTYNDEDTGDHIKRINKYSAIVAEKLKMKSYFINEVGTYASLHDIGKIGIHDTILKKPGKLSKEEFDEMKTHTEIGYNMIKNLGVGSIAMNIIRYHHEKWDGSGYPQKLSGENIPLEARIVGLADVYDALRQKRVYKEAFSHESAVDIISDLSGSHFDPKVVAVFLEIHLDFKRIFEEK